MTTQPINVDEVDHYSVQPRAYHAAIAMLQQLPYHQVIQTMRLLEQGTKILYKVRPTQAQEKEPEPRKEAPMDKPTVADEAGESEEEKPPQDAELATLRRKVPPLRQTPLGAPLPSSKKED